MLFTFPSLTTSDATYSPATSAVNVGIAEVALLNTAALPPGLFINVQLYVNASPFASLLLLPFKVTVAVTRIFCIRPALANGAVFEEGAEIKGGALLFSPPPPHAVNKATTDIAISNLILLIIFKPIFLQSLSRLVCCSAVPTYARCCQFACLTCVCLFQLTVPVYRLCTFVRNEFVLALNWIQQANKQALITFIMITPNESESNLFEYRINSCQYYSYCRPIPKFQQYKRYGEVELI